MSTHRTATLVAFLAGCSGQDIRDRGLELEPVAAYLTGVHPVSAVVADLDGDGDDDVAIPGLVTSDFTALENRGGEIAWHPPVALPDGASDIVAIDIDGDGHTELAATHREIEAVGLYRVSATMELEAIDRIAIDGLVTGLRATDFDGDGDLDLLVTVFDRDVIERVENRGGALVRGDTVATEPGPYCVRLADLDGDGVDELISVAATGARIEIFDTGSWERVMAIETGAWPSWIEVFDIDGDGDLELVGAATIGDRVFAVDVDLERGEASYRDVGAGDGAFAVLAGDFDDDDRVELAVTNKDAGSIQVFAAGDLEPRQVLELGINSGPSPLYGWDLDGDGDPESVVVVGAFANEAQIFRWRRWRR